MTKKVVDENKESGHGIKRDSETSTKRRFVFGIIVGFMIGLVIGIILGSIIV